MHATTRRRNETRRGVAVRAVPARSQPSFQKRVHISLYDVCGPHEKDDESLHQARPQTLSN